MGIFYPLAGYAFLLLMTLPSERITEGNIINV
jgi:hypothetical protein